MNISQRHSSSSMSDAAMCIISTTTEDREETRSGSQPKKDMSTHVTIRTTGRVSEALCEQPTTVSVERLNNRIGSVTDREMQQIDIALQIALNLDAGANTQPEPENQSGGHHTATMM